MGNLLWEPERRRGNPQVGARFERGRANKMDARMQEQDLRARRSSEMSEPDKTTNDPDPLYAAEAPGKIRGDFAPSDELLIDGQEEVFSRAEVESGRIEHQAGTDSRPGEEPAREESR
jgi:hypothetical protein